MEGALELPRYCILYYSHHPDKCLEMQPSLAPLREEWALCGHARHNDSFFESYDLCSTRIADDPSSGFDCETRSSPGVSDADMVLYVTAFESSYCEGAAAYAMYCSLDLETNRPLAGSINFCPSSLSTRPESFDHQVEVAVHELLHTLATSLSSADLARWLPCRSSRILFLTNLLTRKAIPYRWRKLSRSR